MTITDSNHTLLGRTETWLLRAAALLIAGVTAVCFAQSYRQLFDWASTHQVPLWIAWTWPAQLDAFILIGEIFLFVSVVRGWPRRTRVLAWGMALAGLGASLAANLGYLPPGASWSDRGTAVVAPLGATLGLAAGLVALKWVAGDHRRRTTATTTVVDQLATRRQAHAGHSEDAARARIRWAQANGQPLPSARALARDYLRKDGQKVGDVRLAGRLLAEAAS